VHETPPTSQLWAEGWQRSWDLLEQDLVPDRELRIGALLDVVAAMTGDAALVLDLACGIGTVTRRLLDRLPGARAIALDVDPVLLTIASATFADDSRVRVVSGDLREPRWVDALPQQRVDAVVTATALHWLPEAVVRRVYSDVSGVVRPGGVFAHAEEMPQPELPRLGRGLAEIQRAQGTSGRHAGTASWDAWWERAADDPVLRDAVVRRRQVFGTSYPTEEFSPPVDWHITALRDAGFGEVGVTWRSGSGAVVAGIRD
jgi:SAM-dependent methyltransferase